jgi:hypothetical protein
MKLFILIFFVCFKSFSLNLTESELEGWTAENASVLSAFTRSASENSSLLTLFPPQNKKMHRKPVDVIYMQASKKSDNPLLLLIAGTGSNGREGIVKHLANLANQQGVDTIILPNPFTVEFQNSFSFNGLVGSPQQDSKGLEDMINSAIRAVGIYKKYPKKLYVSGFSLGGLHAALLARSSISSKIDKFIILNPTIDFVYGIQKVDQFIAVSDSSMGVGGLDVIDLVDIALDKFSGPAVDLNTYQSMELKYISLDSIRHMFGIVFKSKMEKVVKNYDAGEVFLDLNMDADLVQMKQNLGYVSFANFALKALSATKQASSMDPRLEFQNINLINFLRDLPNVDKIRYIDNIDDFLKTPQQLSALLDNSKIRYTVFSAGGHCGNYWTPSFVKKFSEYLAE